jgi:maltooligosyltrehalose trehalohydrolase
MPFGAELTAAGAVRFRLWASAAQRVELVLYEGQQAHLLAVPASGDGWFELTTAEARAGSRYRYRIDGKLEVPDPASRFNPADVHGPSVVIDPQRFEWTDLDWRPPPWHEAVIYELHTGTFSASGSFAGIEEHLDHLVELGVSVLELMPVADFAGRRGWGYDGVLPFAPDSAYGRPEDLKHLVLAAHARGLAVMLDVVYNHFGPEGNFLSAYAPQFFSARHRTPWGAAINFDGPGSRPVRDFFIHNALYWLTEYHFDGLRLDAVHAIRDDSELHILTEIARAARTGPGRERPIYLVLENAANETRWLTPPGTTDTFDAQWNDDVHNCLHVILTGETEGYYRDYARQPSPLLCRALAEGFAYQGEHSVHEDRARGAPSAHLPPTAFVSFLQNHDQTGNRALGERIGTLTSLAALRAAVALVLLAPSPPLLFMGEEWGAAEPFAFFCDFPEELAAKVRAGRRREFAAFEKFHAPGALEQLPDPGAAATLEASRLEWGRLRESAHGELLDHYRRLIALRRREILPRIRDIQRACCTRLSPRGAFAVDWTLSDGAVLHLLANLTGETAPAVGRTAGRVIFATHNIRAAVVKSELEPWSVTWLLERGHDES